MPHPSKLMRKTKGMSAKAAVIRRINSHDENNNLNVDVEEQWDLRSPQYAVIKYKSHRRLSSSIDLLPIEDDYLKKKKISNDL